MNPKDAAGALKTAGSDSHRSRSHSASVPVPSGRVTSGYVVKQLVADGMLSASDAERFKQSGGRERSVWMSVSSPRRIGTWRPLSKSSNSDKICSIASGW